MAKLESHKIPIHVRVQTIHDAQLVLDFCYERGWEIVVDVEMVLPYNISLYQKSTLETEMRESLTSKLPGCAIRLYAAPCDKACEHYADNLCPVKKAYSVNDIND